MAATMGAWRWLHDRTYRWHEPWVILSMLLVVLFAQNRSVWVVTAAMLLIVFVGTKARLWLRASVAIAIVPSLPWSTSGPGHTSAIGDSLGHAGRTPARGLATGTMARSVGHACGARPVGDPFRSGYGHAWVSGAVGVWEASPHNGFIQIAVRIGLIGALLLFGTYAAVLFALAGSKTPRTAYCSSSLSVFWCTYSLFREHFFGGVARFCGGEQCRCPSPGTARASAGLRARTCAPLRAQPPRQTCDQFFGLSTRAAFVSDCVGNDSAPIRRQRICIHSVDIGDPASHALGGRKRTNGTLPPPAWTSCIPSTSLRTESTPHARASRAALPTPSYNDGIQKTLDAQWSGRMSAPYQESAR